MYYIYGVSVPSLLIESTDSMIRKECENIFVLDDEKLVVMPSTSNS